MTVTEACSNPTGEDAQDHMHKDCMKAVRLTLKAVSEARVRWMSSAAVKKEPRADVPGVAAVPGPPVVVAELPRATKRRRWGAAAGDA